VVRSCYAGPGTFKIWSLAEEDNDAGKYDNEITGLEEPGTVIMERHPETGILAQKHGTGVKCTLTDHVWLVDNSVAIATENKVIFIVKDCEIKYVCSSRNPISIFLHGLISWKHYLIEDYLVDRSFLLNEGRQLNLILWLAV
jgi:hypothetical protein